MDEDALVEFILLFFQVFALLIFEWLKCLAHSH